MIMQDKGRVSDLDPGLTVTLSMDPGTCLILTLCPPLAAGEESATLRRTLPKIH